MNATARLVASAGGRGIRLRSEPPLTLRSTPGAVYLVGSAAGPLGGDDLRIEIDVEERAQLTVRSAAASVVLPGSSPSLLSVRARVAAGGELRWLVEPTVAARRCRHRIDVEIDLAEGARIHWLEELILGRHAEHPGSVSSRLAIDFAGVPLFRHELAVGPEYVSAATSAVVGDARAIGSVVVGGAGVTPPLQGIVVGPTAAVLPLAGPAFQVVALAGDHSALRRLLDHGVSLGEGLPEAQPEH